MRWLARLAVALFLPPLLVTSLGCAHPPPPKPEPPKAEPRPVEPPPPVPVAHRHAVVAEHEAAANAAMVMLEAGGSAADAAVAAMLAAGVAQPVSSGLGGGGIALVWDEERARATMIDFREAAPIGIRPSEYDVRPVPERARGVMVGVPGEVAGMAALVAGRGRLPWKKLFEPAVKLAREGFFVSPHLHRTLVYNQEWLARDEGMGAMLAPSGEPLAPGDLAKNAALAKTLERIAAEGPRAFYEGELAEHIVEGAGAHASLLTLADLESYRVVEREVLTTTWEGYDVHAATPPSVGGLVVAQTLNMHGLAALRQAGFGSGTYLHLLAETFRGALADRVRAIGDPAYHPSELDALVSKERMAHRRAGISPTETRPAPAFALTEGGTANIAVIDAAGNAVVVTLSLNHMFGARIATDGFVLNDQLASFNTSRLDQAFGARRMPNAARGGARPVASLSPTIVTRSGHVVLLLGASGGTRAPGAVTQALLAVLGFARTPGQAVREPRIHAPATGGLQIDPTVSPDVVVDLKRRGERVDAQRPSFSAVGMLLVREVDGRRTIDGAADPRKGGSALVR